MIEATLKSFKSELISLREAIKGINLQTVREASLRERFILLFRSWAGTIKPEITRYSKNEKNVFKLEAELEALANLASKCKKKSEYQKRINRAIVLLDSLVIYIPNSEAIKTFAYPTIREELFTPEISDLPTRLVPNPLLGWRKDMQAFLQKYPFDKSVFIMIKYRKQNEKLVDEIQSVLSEAGFNGILASEHKITDDLYNPIACLLCCSKGIAVFDQAEKRQVFNPNVAYELGMLHLMSRDCLILKHVSLKALHSDILMKIYIEYTTLNNARKKVQHWVRKASE